MDNINKIVKHFVKTLLAAISIKAIIVISILLIIIILFGSIIWFLQVKVDGSSRNGDSDSVPYVVDKEISNINVNLDGRTFSTTQTPQEIWDSLIENNSRVDLYLDSADELAKLMFAELVTKYPDLRENPDEPIDWDNMDYSNLQGIIKFKRLDSNGNTYTLTYTDPDTFNYWMNQYETTGSNEARDYILTHFTLSYTSETSGIGTVTAGDGVITDVSQAILDAAGSVGSPGYGWCLAWVDNVYDAAGVTVNTRYTTAWASGDANIISTDMTNIPIGATVYGTGTSDAGHVGIYIGDGKVIDNQGDIVISDLQTWISWQRPIGVNGTGWRGWGWADGNRTRGTVDDTNANYVEGEGTDNTDLDNEDSTEEDTSSDSTYSVLVATWTQVDINTTYGSGTSEADAIAVANEVGFTIENSTTYTISTTKINYAEAVANYTLPFDVLWAFLVNGKDKDFVFDFANLAYNSEIVISIHDNLTVNVDTDILNFDKIGKAEVSGSITAVATYNYENGGTANGISSTVNIDSHVHDGDNEDVEAPVKTSGTITKVKTTQTNTMDVALTKANVWIVDYENDYTLQTPEETSTSSSNSGRTEYSSSPTSVLDSYNCTEVVNARETARNNTYQLNSGDVEITLWESINANIYYRYDYNVDSTYVTTTTKYVAGTPTLKEKIDEDTAPNFVTIYKDDKYSKFRNTLYVPWLLEIIENNDNTGYMYDLISYLIYYAKGKSYGVTEFDFSIFYPSSMTSLIGDWTQAGTVQEKLWLALRNAGFSEFATAGVMGNIAHESGDFNTSAIEDGSGEGIGLAQWSFERRDQLEAYAASKGVEWFDENTQIEFLLAEMGVDNNASAYASYQFSSATGYSYGDFANAESVEEATTAFCWSFERPLENTANLSSRIEYALYYYNLYKGLSSNEFVSIAQSVKQLVTSQKYTYGAGIPENSSKLVDCSGYVCAVLRQYGYTEFGGNGLRSTSDFISRISGSSFTGYSDWQVMSYSKSSLKAGDILLRNGHMAIYAGNGLSYDCGSTQAIWQETVSVDYGGPWTWIIRVN